MRSTCLVPLLAAVLAGCAHRPPMDDVAPPPAPAPPPAAAPAEVPAPIEVTVSGTLCGFRNGELVEFAAEQNLETGDTLIAGRPYTQLYPLTGEYAAVSRWYYDNEPFTFRGACYVKYGLPRYLLPRTLRRIGTYRGIPLFGEEQGDGEHPGVLYVLVRPCAFQAYQTELVFRPCGASL